MNDCHENQMSLLADLKNIFHLERKIVDGDEYDSLSKLIEAFSNNIMWDEAYRKADAALIFYSLIKILASPSDMNELYNFEIFLLHIMPPSWHWKWKETKLKHSFDPYLQTYTTREAEVILNCLKYVYPFCYKDEQELLDDVMEYWNKMAYHRSKLLAERNQQ